MAENLSITSYDYHSIIVEVELRALRDCFAFHRTQAMNRPRGLYASVILLVIATGLLSRRIPGLFPPSFGKYPGDALWAVMIFVGFGFLFPAVRTIRIGLMALTFSCAIEFSQIYRAAWIDSIRATTLGHLVLGRGFSWMDIAAYSVGILLACLVETGLFRLKSLR